MIRCIVAVDQKLGIANEDGIPWDIPIDKEYFRNKTINSIVLMGYGAYIEFDKPLPYRRNVVASRDTKPLKKGFELITDVDKFLKDTKEDIWISGGANIYQQFIKYAEELYITEIDADFKCTKFFPEYKKDFKLKSASETKTENGIPFRFKVYRRK